jgi:hypothetical protein
MPLPARPRRAPRALPAAAAVALAACGRDPVSPATLTTAAGYTASTPVTGSVARAWYGDTALTFERKLFYWADQVDFARQESAILPRVRSATSHGALWSAATASIDPWLRQAGDEHSAFFPPTDAPGVVDAEPGDRRFLVSGATLPAESGAPLAYLWLPTFTGKNDVGRADSTQTVIRALDQSGPCGWVLDLRLNPGGTWAAMLAGINPLLGDAPASRTQTGFGGFVERTGARAYFYVEGGDAGVYDPFNSRRYSQVKTTTNYQLRRPGSPVAVLTGPLTASAGEMITLGFRGGPVPHRSFGEPTYGVTTTPVGIYLRPDSGYLNITAGIMFDRAGTLYGRAVQPDEPVTGLPCRPSRTEPCQVAVTNFGAGYDRATPTPSVANDAVLRAATTWLRAQPACSNAPAAQRGPSASRAPAPASQLPGEVKPSNVPGRVSPYFVPRSLRELIGR